MVGKSVQERWCQGPQMPDEGLQMLWCQGAQNPRIFNREVLWSNLHLGRLFLVVGGWLFREMQGKGTLCLRWQWGTPANLLPCSGWSMDGSKWRPNRKSGGGRKKKQRGLSRHLEVKGKREREISDWKWVPVWSYLGIFFLSWETFMCRSKENVFSLSSF